MQSFISTSTNHAHPVRITRNLCAFVYGSHLSAWLKCASIIIHIHVLYVYITDTNRSYSPYRGRDGVTVFCGKISSNRIRITASDCSIKLPYICISGKPIEFWWHLVYSGLWKLEKSLKGIWVIKLGLNMSFNFGLPPDF